MFNFGKNGQAIAIFDRDDTLLVDRHYMHRPEDICWVEGALDALRLLSEGGYRICVATNQSGIARGYFSENRMHAFHAAMQDGLRGEGLKIDGFFHCPHHPEGVVEAFSRVCDCRKPQPGLLHQIDQRFSVDRQRSFLIGDKPSDVGAARAFGIPGYLFDGSNLFRLVERVLRDRVETDPEAMPI